MTLNDARDKIVAADPENRTVFVSAQAAFYNHYKSHDPSAREADFTVQVFAETGGVIKSFFGPSLAPLVQQAIDHVTDRASDDPAEAVSEGDGS